jgi:hypothetical protein
MAATPRGHIEKPPSGSFRVHVYAGTDPVTGKPRRIRETCPDGATTAATLGCLLARVRKRRNPRQEPRLGSDRLGDQRRARATTFQIGHHG